ncbi:MAG: phosphatase PAP2 family protein [Candidatus Izemoplasmataceae bacterium]
MTIDFIIFLQSFASDAVIAFFNFISFLGEESMYIIVLAVWYFAIDKKLGQLFALILGITALINNTLKEFFSVQRPFQAYPDLVTNYRPETSTGHSFPSGHTQNFSTMLFSFAFIYKKWMIPLAIVFTIFMMLSRMFLGVHFLEDVMVAAILGILIAYMLVKLYQIKGLLPIKQISIALLLITGIFLFIFEAKDFFTSYGLLLGLTFGVLYEHKYVKFTISVSPTKKVLRVIIGLVLLLGLQVGLKELFTLIFPNLETLSNVIRYFLIGFIGFGLYPKTFKIFNW